MIIYKTRNSTYEVDPDLNRARYAEGLYGPTAPFRPEGEWKDISGFSEIDHPAGGSVVFFGFPDGQWTMTSLIESVHYAPEPFEVP